MLRFLLVNVTGWSAVLVTGVVAALPYMLRNTVRGAATQWMGENRTAISSVRARMWPHYWLGYLLVGLILVHSSFVMGPAIGRSDNLGIWAATLALLLLFVQLGVGLVLKSGVGNRPLRRWHFWGMTVFVGLILTHLARNT